MSLFSQVAKGVLKNSSIMLFQHVFTMASSFAVMLFLPRYLGPQEYGRLYLAMALTGMFQILVNYGSGYLIVKKVAREPEQTASIFINTLAFRLMLAALSCCLMMGVAFVLQYSREVFIVLIVFSVNLFVGAGNSTLFACFQGHGLLKYTSISAMADRLFSSTVIILALLLGAKALGIAVIGALAGALNLTILVFYSRHIFLEKPKVQWGSVFTEFQSGFPYFLFAVFSTIYYRIDVIMLSKMTPEVVVGHYGASYRLFESLNLPYILTTALYPVLSRLWGKEEEIHKRTMQKSLEYVILLGLPLSVGVIWFSREAIGLFYGLSAYEPSIVLLQVLTGGLVFLYVDMILGTTLLASDKQKQLMIISLVAIVANVLLNYLLIPIFQVRNGNGAIGAALATGITEMGIMVSALYLLPRGLLIGFRVRMLFKSFVATGIMTIVLWFFETINVFWPFCILIAICSYAGMTLALRILEPVEQKFFMELVANKFKKLKQSSGL